MAAATLQIDHLTPRLPNAQYTVRVGAVEVLVVNIINRLCIVNIMSKISDLVMPASANAVGALTMRSQPSNAVRREKAQRGGPNDAVLSGGTRCQADRRGPFEW